jgi:hypothetical protein
MNMLPKGNYERRNDKIFVTAGQSPAPPARRALAGEYSGDRQGRGASQRQPERGGGFSAAGKVGEGQRFVTELSIKLKNRIKLFIVFINYSIAIFVSRLYYLVVLVEKLEILNLMEDKYETETGFHAYRAVGGNRYYCYFSSDTVPSVRQGAGKSQTGIMCQ